MEKERDRERETDRQTERQSQRERESIMDAMRYKRNGAERACVGGCGCACRCFRG